MAIVFPYLKRAHIVDYRSIKNVTADFKPGINIIIGPNGAGKTNFLSLTSELIVPYFLPERGEGCELIIASARDFKVSFGQRPFKNSKIALDRHALNLRERIPVTVEVEESRATSNFLSDAFTELQVDDIPYYWPLAVWHGIRIDNTPVIGNSSDLKISNGGLAEFESYNWLDNPASSILTDELLVCVRKLFADKAYSIANLSVKRAKNAIERTVNLFVSALNDYLEQFSPVSSVRLNEAFQLYINKEQDEIIVKGLVLEYQINSSWLPFSALSDGTKRVIYIISQLVSPILSATLNKKTKKFNLVNFDKILFIEEPELGIHHSQLHKLLQLIREISQEHQIIMTTHAPQVLDMLSADELDRITVCSLDPEKGTQFHKLSEEKQEQARVYMQEVGFLSDYWRYSYLEKTEAE